MSFSRKLGLSLGLVVRRKTMAKMAFGLSLLLRCSGGNGSQIFVSRRVMLLLEVRRAFSDLLNLFQLPTGGVLSEEPVRRKERISHKTDYRSPCG